MNTGMPRTRRPHGSVFTPAQNRALRAELRRIRGAYDSQAALGSAIGVEQQNAGRLLNDADAGFSYATATAVARLAGFAGVDALFRAKGVALDLPHAKAG